MVSTMAMIERHYDEEALIALLGSKRADSDAHLQSCTGCTEKLESFQMIAEALQDRDVWDAREVRSEAVPATIATLRSFADRMTEEDSAAESLLTELLAGDRETWLPRLHAHPEWCTAGVVRKLIEAASRAIDTMPPDAVEMTALATEIAETLDPAAFPSDTVPRLRGAAWRERAYALYYTGRYNEAQSALFASEERFSCCVVGDYDLARSLVIRALVRRPLEQIAGSLLDARGAATIFARFGDVHRFRSSRSAEAAVYVSTGEHRRALDIWSSIDRAMADDDASDARGRIIANIAHCYRELGDLPRAIAETDMALSMFEHFGAATEAARLRWNYGRLLRAADRLPDALKEFLAVASQFEELGMASEATLASLDAVELMLIDANLSKVQQICSAAIERLERTGLGWTTRAMTAIAYLKEAAAAEHATIDLLTSVRTFVLRVPDEPQLLFAPPPPELAFS